MKRQILRRRISYISFFLFPATFVYLSPYVIVDASAKGIISGRLLMIILLFIGSYYFGRAFCSWACPIGGAQEILSPLKKKFAIKGGIIKWLIWVPWIITIIVVAIHQGGYQEIDPFFRTTHGFSLGNIYTIIAYLAILSLVLITYFTGIKKIHMDVVGILCEDPWPDYLLVSFRIQHCQTVLNDFQLLSVLGFAGKLKKQPGISGPLFQIYRIHFRNLISEQKTCPMLLKMIQLEILIFRNILGV